MTRQKNSWRILAVCNNRILQLPKNIDYDETEVKRVRRARKRSWELYPRIINTLTSLTQGTLTGCKVLLCSISGGSMIPSTYTIWYCLHLICLRDRRRCRNPELLLWMSSKRPCICLAECEGSNNRRYKPPSFPECSSTPITSRLWPAEGKGQHKKSWFRNWLQIEGCESQWNITPTQQNGKTAKFTPEIDYPSGTNLNMKRRVCRIIRLCR